MKLRPPAEVSGEAPIPELRVLRKLLNIPISCRYDLSQVVVIVSREPFINAVIVVPEHLRMNESRTSLRILRRAASAQPKMATVDSTGAPMGWFLWRCFNDVYVHKHSGMPLNGFYPRQECLKEEQSSAK